jgi:hypothetical protein
MSPAERERLTAVVRDLMSRASAPRIVADTWAAMLEVADKADEFSANDVRRIICPDGHTYIWRQGDPGIDCDPRRAVGAVYNILAAAGVIEATGRFVQNSDTAGMADCRADRARQGRRAGDTTSRGAGGQLALR